MSSSVPNNDSNTNVQSPMGNYPKLARFMGSWPDMSIFRKFGALNAQDLLYRQAELAYLEEELKTIQEEDEADESLPSPESGKEDGSTASDPKLSQYWWKLSQKDGSEHRPQYQKVLEIRGKLAEFNDALLKYHELCKLHKPSKTDLCSLRSWLSHKDGGDCFLTSYEADAWDDDRKDLENDLVAMSEAHHQKDLFSRFLSDYFVRWFELRFGGYWKTKTPDLEAAGLSYYKDTRLNAASHFIGTMIASLLPAVSIFVLYFVHNMLARLGAIMAFSALFSFTLAVFTTAKRIEIFAATAAFASVQVVFVGSTYGGLDAVNALLNCKGTACSLQVGS